MYNFYRSLQHTTLVQQKGEYLKSPAIGIFGEKDPQATDEGTPYNHNAYLKFSSRKLFSNTDFEASIYGTSLYTIFDFRKHNPKKPRWEEKSGQATIKDQKDVYKRQVLPLRIKREQHPSPCHRISWSIEKEAKVQRS